ncbi:M1 family aminopeptidase [Flavobacterium sp. '19STA2R22 D10 B1']|uniref:M1 family aminopeptidase n=1 Tax=Flavobacterium aerium TaxID=3037261 RepID=UPI00278BFAAC|nr:M1 family aminopeptidase [Flavobacterium sp. '19STA2R22 D10 B1']
MVWIFLAITTFFSILLFGSQGVTIGGAVGSLNKNAPYIVEAFYAVFSVFFLIMVTAFMNATAMRDFQYNMYQFIFSSPIKKRDYFFGKFIGASIISLIPMLGVSIGAILAPVLAPLFPESFDMAPPERFGPIIWSGHLDGILVFAIPNIIIAGVLLYSLAFIFKNNIVSFISVTILIVVSSISGGFAKDIKKEWLSSLLDPFGRKAFSIMTKYTTVIEKNTSSVGLEGDLLINRLAWLVISIIILAVVYRYFSFNLKKEKVKKNKKEQLISTPVISDKVFHPTTANAFSFGTFINLVRFETKAIIKNPVFIVITAIGMILLITALSSFTSRYGTSQYPVTYSVIDSIDGSFFLFLIGFITFYSGVLVWKERDAKLNEIEDSTPIKTGILFSSKALAVIIAIAIIYIIAIIVGITAQALHGYTRFELGLYVEYLLVIKLLHFSYLVVLALLLHYLINNRYLGYFAFIAFIIVDSFVWGLFKISSNMVSFGTVPGIIYSDMNGFGPFIPGTIWFNVYWFLFSIILCFVCVAFYTRGKETSFKNRLKTAKRRLQKNGIALTVVIVAFIGCAGYVYYNTKVLNTYVSNDDVENMQVEYEKKFKKYETIAQPRFYKLDYNIDLIPEERSLKAKVVTWARNISNETIKEIHFTMPRFSDSIQLTVPGAKLTFNDKKLHYRIYTLDRPLAPNDSIKIGVDVSRVAHGFENDVSFTSVTQNGSFFNNMDLMPSIGYNNGYEISDKNTRKKYKLPKRDPMPKLDENNIQARMNTYLSTDSDWVEVNTTISTSPDQIAIAPGSLLKTWEDKGRKYFNYKLDHKSVNFYSFMSAKYEVARKKWNGIDLEVYYDKNHAYNVPNMMNSMQKSLEYYTTHFGPYMHKQCRIIEFPRYQSFAQAFPGTMPYSEGIGFILDQRDAKEDGIDQVFYVVAHEMAHQYWAHQLIGANMQGSEMMSEGFAQYSALMVMEKEYGKDKMKKFLQYEMDGYLNGRSSETEEEQPLMKTQGQQYIHYNKASVVMYYLKEMIGEDKVNQALQSLIQQYGYKNPPYPTSIAAVNEFKKVTPPDMQYLITDMFETITVFSNRALKTTYKKSGDGYQVTLTTSSEKFKADGLGRETSIPINDYIDVAVFGKPENNYTAGKVLAYQRVKVTKKDNTYTFTTKEIPYQAGIDPYNYLIDRIPDDNIKIAD